MTPADYDELADRVARFAGALAEPSSRGGLPAAAPVGRAAGRASSSAAPGTAVADPDRLRRAPRPWPATASTPVSSTPCCAGGWRWPPGPTRSCSPGLAHGERQLALAVEAAGEAAAEVATALAAEAG